MAWIQLIDHFPQNPKDMASSTYHTIQKNAAIRSAIATEAKKATEFVTNLLLQTEFNEVSIASLAGVSIDFVKSIKTVIDSIRQTNFDDEKIASLTNTTADSVQLIREKVQKDVNGQSGAN